MEVVGLGIIAACMFVGMTVGTALAQAIGLSGDVGGVGFAMLLLVLISNYVKLDEKVRNGIQFISNLYIPIIVAMASIQNVAGALRGGWVAILGGGLAVVLSFLLVPVVVNLGKPSTKNRGVKA